MKHNNPFKYTFSLDFDTVTILLVFYGDCVECFHISEWIILCSVSLLTPTGKAGTLLVNNLSKRAARHTLLSHSHPFYFCLYVAAKIQIIIDKFQQKRKKKTTHCHNFVPFTKMCMISQCGCSLTFIKWQHGNKF